MSTENSLINISVLAGENLSSLQYRFGVINTSGVVVSVPSAGGRADGVIQNKPESGQVCTLAVAGVSKVRVGSGGLATPGLQVQSDADGNAIAAASGDYVAGINLDAGADGDIVRVLLKSDHLLA